MKNRNSTSMPLRIGALAALILPAGVVCAQSNVTIYGILDSSVMHASGSIASKTQLFSGSSLGSRIGFRGHEDLGGGMAAGFVLESGLAVDSGSGQASNSNNQASGATPPAAGGQGLTFNRESYVYLSGGWGELRLGRSMTPAWRAQASMDPAAVGVGLWTAQTALASLAVLGHPAGIRASNSIGYYTPVYAGFAGQFMYAMGENASNSGATKNDGDVYGARIFYAEGPLKFVAAYETIKSAAVGDIKETVIGANYDFGVAKLWAQYLHDTSGLGNKVNGQAVSVTAPYGPMEFRVGWSRSKVETQSGTPKGTVNKLALFGAYKLSKRTAIYSTMAFVRNRDGATQVPFTNAGVTAPNASSRGYEIGLRHIF